MDGLDRGPSRDAAPTPSRRAVLACGAAAAFLGLAGTARTEEPAAAKSLPRRALGRTGLEVTRMGLGCFPLGGMPSEEDAVGVLLEALDQGCNYLDTAPSYARGRSEERVGRALRLRPASKVIVATKTHTRTAVAARRDLEGSLKRLGVERLDLVQVHAITTTDDLDRVLGDGGPVEALEKARSEGLVRFIGATGHADPVVLEKAAASGAFDTLLLPLNCVDPHHLSFESGTLPTALEKGVGVIGMKVFASGNLVKAGVDAASCLRYAFGLDVATTIVGCRTRDEVKTAARLARDPQPLTEAQQADLLRRTLPHRGKGVEWYKRA